MTDKLLCKILSKRGEGVSSLTTFVNPYSYMRLRKHPSLFSAFNNVLLDGISLVVLCRVLTGRHFGRASFDFSSLAGDVFRNAEQDAEAVYLIGAKEFDIEAAAANILAAYPQLRLLGHRSGYFQSRNEYCETCRRIALLRPDIIIAGLGTPKQPPVLLVCW